MGFAAKSFRRSASGRMTPNGSGRRLESTVIASQCGIVRLDQMTAGVRWIGGRPTPVRGPVDFLGEVCATGRSICFDAKSCADPYRFPLANVAPHQVEYLVRHGQAKAIAGLLMEATHPEQLWYFWLPWSELLRFQVDRVASIPWDSSGLVRLGQTSYLIQFRNVPGVAGV